MTPEQDEKEAAITRLMAVIGNIVTARDDENFEALITAIAEAEAEVVIIALERSNLEKNGG